MKRRNDPNYSAAVREARDASSQQRSTRSPSLYLWLDDWLAAMTSIWSRIIAIIVVGSLAHLLGALAASWVYDRGVWAIALSPSYMATSPAMWLWTILSGCAVPLGMIYGFGLFAACIWTIFHEEGLPHLLIGLFVAQAWESYLFLRHSLANAHSMPWNKHSPYIFVAEAPLLLALMTGGVLLIYGVSYFRVLTFKR